MKLATGMEGATDGPTGAGLWMASPVRFSQQGVSHQPPQCFQKEAFFGGRESTIFFRKLRLSFYGE